MNRDDVLLAIDAYRCYGLGQLAATRPTWGLYYLADADRVTQKAALLSIWEEWEQAEVKASRRVQVDIQLGHGTRMVSAEPVAPGLVLHESYDDGMPGEGWTLTHIATGFALGGDGPRERLLARAAKLAELADWSVTYPDELDPETRQKARDIVWE